MLLSAHRGDDPECERLPVTVAPIFAHRSLRGSADDITADDLPGSKMYDLTEGPAAAVPLAKARNLLAEALRSLPRVCLSSTSKPAPAKTHAEARCIRIEVGVTDIESEEDSICWLRAQLEDITPRLYFRVPDRSLIMAGIGAAHLVTGPQALSESEISSFLSTEGMPRGVTYYGTSRFDPTYSKTSADWNAFGTTYMVLPSVELVRNTAKASGRDDLQHSVGFRLVANMRYRSLTEYQEAQMRTLRTVRELCVDYARGQASDVPLPAPISCEQPSQFNTWHEGISQALSDMKAGRYRKVVLARAIQLTFPRLFQALHLVLRLQDHYGYLFCLQVDRDRAFLGCTPEQLFKVSDSTVTTEALAGTRPRGHKAEEDERLAAELMASQKDRLENDITAQSIEESLQPLVQDAQVTRCPGFVLRLRHVQHICHKMAAKLRPPEQPASYHDAPRQALQLLRALHPTPAVAGYPTAAAMQAIRILEPFDRGLYAGPVGYISASCSEFAVAIRSVLLVREKAHVFAGAGIVPGSTAEGEWAEIGAKMANFIRMFPSAATPLRSLPNLSTLWATLVIEELARNGVNHFCVAPGSRSTPLVTAAARHPNVTLTVYHDERGAGFYCVGYARATGRPAGVIVTSGTAVANLLPAAVEAATAHVPLLLLTADRPPEARDCGANQTVPQINIFSSFVRWTKDVPCPTPEILASALLSDIDCAVSIAAGTDPGPVHLNFMFRENLAPEGGAVRDSAVPGLSSEWSHSCLNDYRFAQWERDVRPYTTFPRLRSSCTLPSDITQAIKAAGRGMLVFGRLPQPKDRAYAAWLAQLLRWPVFADIGSGLRGRAGIQHLLIGQYEAIIADPLVSSALDPDVILQMGAPLISKRLTKLVANSRARAIIQINLYPVRHDPELAASHHLCSDLPSFVEALDDCMPWEDMSASGLLPLLKRLSQRLEQEVSKQLECHPAASIPTEPMVAHLIAKSIPYNHGLFLSNSMPVRDADAYASSDPASTSSIGLNAVGINRGASGIDGILSSAIGYATGLRRPITLLIGDMACLHDLNALHVLSTLGSEHPPVTVVLINNHGGGIFSFLPIVHHADVFSPFFDSAHELSFGPISQAFNLPYTLCRSASEFKSALGQAQASGTSSIVEVVTDRTHNVREHRQLNVSLSGCLHRTLLELSDLSWVRTGPRGKPTLLLLHGFLGCKEDWGVVLASGPGRGLALDYDCIAVDLPGHGTTSMRSPGRGSSVLYSLPAIALGLIRLLDQLGISRFAIMGYSMGGRVGAYLARQFSDRVSSLIMLSAHPGLRTEYEKVTRSLEEHALHCRLQKAIRSAESWHSFLRWWYSKPLWGSLAERTPSYTRMIARRQASLAVTDDRGGVARALLGMSLARQPNLWTFIQSGSFPTLFIYGAADCKYAAVAEEIRAAATSEGPASAKSAVEVRCIDDAGHAVITEKESEVLREVTAFLRRHVEDAQLSNSSVCSSAPRLASLCWSTFRLPFREPVSLNQLLYKDRGGLLLLLRSDSGHVGIGEVSPLPGFSFESLTEAEAELRLLGELLPGRALPCRNDLARWTEWLSEGWSWRRPRRQRAPRKDEVCASVQAGVEMALVHLLAQEYGVNMSAVLSAARPHLVHASQVHLNEVTLQGSGTRCRPRSGVCKLKVGGRSVQEELARVRSFTERLQRSVRLRLDANRAWTFDEALQFIEGLEDPGLIDYIEEPLQHVEDLAKLWIQSRQRVMFAMDESLVGLPFARARELLSMSGLAAIVVKPTLLGGLSACLKLHDLALKQNVPVVVTSAFESSVGLAHCAILASTLRSVSELQYPDPIRHGLSTFEIFGETDDGLAKGFAEFCVDDRLVVNVAKCQELLRQFVTGNDTSSSNDRNESGHDRNSSKPEVERVSTPERLIEEQQGDDNAASVPS